MYIFAIHDIIKITRARVMAIGRVVDVREKSLNCVFMLINDEARDFIPILIIFYHLTKNIMTRSHIPILFRKSGLMGIFMSVAETMKIHATLLHYCQFKQVVLL